MKQLGQATCSEFEMWLAGRNDIDESFDVLRPAATFAAGKRWPFPSLDAQSMKDVGTRPCSVFGAPCGGGNACHAGPLSSEARAGAATPPPLGTCGSHEATQDGAQALGAQAPAAQAPAAQDLAAQDVASLHTAPAASSRPHQDEGRAQAQAHATTRALKGAARGDGCPGKAAGGGSEREEAADSVSPQAAGGGWAHQQAAQGEDPILVYLPLVKNEVCSLRCSASAPATLLQSSCYFAAYLDMISDWPASPHANSRVRMSCAHACAHGARPCMFPTRAC